MTTFEHAMLGVNGALAAGLHRHFGWQVAAVAGLAAVSPDWDGLPILFSVSVFDAAHRVWGHNVFACLLLGITIGVLDYRFDLVTRTARIMTRLLRLDVDPSRLAIRSTFASRGLKIWLVVATMAALSQIPADLVVSGTATLNDWELRLFWPLSNQGYIFPLVEWGDIGVSAIFVAGMFAMARWRNAARRIAIVTLAAVLAYIGLRGLV